MNLTINARSKTNKNRLKKGNINTMISYNEKKMITVHGSKNKLIPITKVNNIFNRIIFHYGKNIR
ncbi:MAG: hypothetical protein DRH70_08165 [Candidatus Coatesbacteria bacterium]|nr:MAG: hypothetical protein DRH70_08165 [Candidatus Coatesbacteria bacterium]